MITTKQKKNTDFQPLIKYAYVFPSSLEINIRTQHTWRPATFVLEHEEKPLFNKSHILQLTIQYRISKKKTLAKEKILN